MKRKIPVLIKFVMFPALAAMLFSGVIIPTKPADAALQAAGPISTAHGFPTWYQDTTGLALQPCLGTNPDGTGPADPNCVLPLPGEEPNYNPTLSASFPGNFPGEFFYWIGDAGPIDVGTVGAKAKFRMALEGAFATVDGSPAPGQQIAFLRINFAVNKVNGTNGLTPNSTYAINHPFGSFSVTTDALGNIIGAGGADFRAEDGAFTPPLTDITAVSFITAVNTNIGPFLKAVTPAAPAGYIGNPNITQTITPGPGGAVFSMSGPGVNVSTDQWALAGKVAVIDTVPPVIGTTSPAAVTVGSANIGASVNITDNLFIGLATIDLGPLGTAMEATINGANAGTASAGTGTGLFTINPSLNTLLFNISISGLTGIEQSARLVSPTGLFALPAGTTANGVTTKIGVWNYPEAAEADILNGNTAVEIQTNALPTPEIKGLIQMKKDVRTMTRSTGTVTNGTWFINIPSANRIGTFNLPLSVSDGSNTTVGNFVLNVVSPLASVSVTPAASTIVVGTTQALAAAPVDLNGTPFVGGTTAWTSSDPAVATVSATGVVTGIAPGTATITGSVTGAGATVTDTSVITVTPVPVLTSVTITPNPVSIVVNQAQPAGTTRQLSAQVSDQLGAPFAGATITWTSANPAAATVNASGLVTTVAPGSTLIKATAVSGTVTASGTSLVTVTTAPQVLTSITLAPATASIQRGANQALTATALDQFDGPMASQPAFTFTSSNPSVAAVDANGRVSGVAVGTAVITAQSGTLSATSNITVTPAPQVLTSITITPQLPNMLPNTTKQLSAAAKDQFGDPMAAQPAITWTSGSAVVTIDANGLLTSGAATGTALITARNGLISGTTTASIVNDIVPPVITIIGSNPITVGFNSTYSDAGATALDGTDGNVTVQTVNPVNTGIAGTYTVTYTATDSIGNVSTAQRTVIVSTPPSRGGGGGGGGFSGGSVSVQPVATAPNKNVQEQIDRQLEIERQSKNEQKVKVLGVSGDFRKIQLEQIENEAELVMAKSLDGLLKNSGMSKNSKKETEIRSKYLVKLKAGVKGLSGDDDTRIANFIAYGTANTKKSGEGERAGAIDSFKAAFGKLPTTKSDWQDVIKIANGRFPGQTNAAAEARAKTDFKKIYKRDADMSNEFDKAAVNVMAYGLRPDKRRPESEKAAIASFKALMKKIPSSAHDWDMIRAIAYSGARR